jgi:hypothetical protein
MLRLLLACCLTLSACGVADTTTTTQGPQYLGQSRLSPGETLDGTVIGGLSGISYDPGSGLYYIVSDDRSAKNPATLSPSGRYPWATMEGPGYNDGELPREGHGALTRVTRFDIETSAATAQYAYPLDKVTSGQGGDNGLTDLSPLDNIEGITLGPKLPDGRQSLVLVSDDNLSPTQVTQFLAFAM